MLAKIRSRFSEPAKEPVRLSDKLALFARPTALGLDEPWLLDREARRAWSFVVPGGIEVPFPLGELTGPLVGVSPERFCELARRWAGAASASS